MSETGYVLLTTVLDQGAAQMIRGVLETNDITCMVHETNPAAIGVGFMNIGVMVAESQLDAARRLLKELESHEI